MEPNIIYGKNVSRIYLDDNLIASSSAYFEVIRKKICIETCISKCDCEVSIDIHVTNNTHQTIRDLIIIYEFSPMPCVICTNEDPNSSIVINGRTIISAGELGTFCSKTLKLKIVPNAKLTCFTIVAKSSQLDYETVENVLIRY